MKSRVGRIETEAMKASHLVKNQIKLTSHKAMTKGKRNRDKSDFSTIQNVFDRITLSTLSKLEVNGFYTKLGMCISTGKEANVYRSETVDGTKVLVIKIYKTMVTNFKDRTDYIQGDFRFRRVGKQVRTNQHKMTNLWAEKEFRNLLRMNEVGIACPEAIKVKENVLIMGMLGIEGKAFPRLRDVKMEIEEISNVYLECLFLMRKMFIKVDLVHGDFSEFNLLYDKENQKLFVIDVSQSVHSHHPLAFEFLKRDIYNINFYFNKLGISVFPFGKIFQFIVDKKLTIDKKKDFIEKMIENSLQDMNEDPEKKEFEVFLEMNIPTNLYEMDLLEIEKKLKSGDYKKYFYSKMIGLGDIDENEELVKEENTQKNEEEDLKESKDQTKNIETNEEIKKINTKLNELILMDDQNKFGEIKLNKVKDKKKGGDSKYGHLNKKERKKLVKEEKREKRKNKMPKKMKKKLINKKTRGNKKK